MEVRSYFVLFLLLFSLFMGLSFATASLFITSNLISAKQLQQKALIEQFAMSNLSDDAKLLSKQLKASINFEFLTITDTNNNVLYRYMKDQNKLLPISLLLKKLNLFTPVQRVKTNPGNLVIKFQPSYEVLLKPLSVITLIAFSAPIMLSFLVYLLAEYVMDKRLNRISAQLESLIHNNTKKKPPKNIPKQIAQFDFVIKGLEKLQQASNSDAFEPDDTVDKLTELPTGLEFIKFYQQEVHDSGTFVLIRCKELQQINLKQGYRAGNQYIQKIAESLKQLSNEDILLFKLNGFDFGVLIFDNSLSAEDFLTSLQVKLDSTLPSYDLPSNIGKAIVPFLADMEVAQLLSIADKKAEH